VVAIAMQVVVALVWPFAMHGDPKPLKFAVSIAIFLATIAYLLAIIELDVRARSAIAWTLALAMIVEMIVISTQAMRGVGSHFNTTTPFDAALWKVMLLAFVVALVPMFAVAWFATTRELRCGPVVAFGLRIGLWLVIAVAISGFAMGGRMQHSVGGADGGNGLPLAGWSRDHGDLRVSHFFALHGLQVLPLVGFAIERITSSSPVRWSVALACALGWVALSIATLVQALAGRPLAG
jgi:hypothetical protein